MEYVRNTGLYLFAQDSWKIKPNLTLNYGLRWELDTPLADKAKHVQTYRPGQSSTVFPCGGPNTDCSSQMQGLVVPGDPGVPPGMTQTYYKAFRHALVSHGAREIPARLVFVRGGDFSITQSSS